MTIERKATRRKQHSYINYKLEPAGGLNAPSADYNSAARGIELAPAHFESIQLGARIHQKSDGVVRQESRKAAMELQPDADRSSCGQGDVIVRYQYLAPNACRILNSRNEVCALVPVIELPE